MEFLHSLIALSGFPNSLPGPDGQLPLDQAREAPSGKTQSHSLSVKALLILGASTSDRGPGVK